MIDAIKQHMTMIVICGCTFLVGVGIGGAISDALNKWIVKGEKSNEEKAVYMGRGSSENTGRVNPDKAGKKR